MDHLTSRVENSRGKIWVPVSKMLQMFYFVDYLREGYVFKKLVTDLNCKFISYTLEYAPDKISGDFFDECMKCLSQ